MLLSGYGRRLLALAALVTCTLAAGSIEIRIESIENTENRLDNGMCCGADAYTKAACAQPCRPLVNICLKSYAQALDAKSLRNISHCPYGSTSLPAAHSLPAVARIPFTVAWPSPFVVAMEVRHPLSNGSTQLVFSTLAAIAVETLGETLAAEPSPGHRMRYSVSLQCDAHYYGAHCSRYCQPQDDDSRGHYACSATGAKRCTAGWTGARCTEPLCTMGCGAHGSCIAPDTCRCESGYEGPTCAQCIPHPGCKHGYCTEPFNCVCEPRYGGLYCELDLDYCHHRSPCQNGGICHPGKPCRPDQVCDYTCECPDGFTGQDCSIPTAPTTSPCASSPCANGGTCYDQSNGTPQYTCICAGAEFSGHNCEIVDDSMRARNMNGVNAGVEGASCQYAGRVYHNEQRWSTTDCRQCDCTHGTVSCTAAACTQHNCLTAHSSCPSDQVCHPTVGSACLSPAGCGQSARGHCLPPSLVVKQLTRQCQRAQSDCARIHIEFDAEKMPEGSTVDDVCHALLLVLLTNRLTHYALNCEPVKHQPHSVQVLMTAVESGWSLQGVPDVLVSLLRYNQTAFPALRAASTARLLQMQRDTDTVVEMTDETSAVVWLCLAAALCLTLCCALGLCACLLKHQLGRRHMTSSAFLVATAAPAKSKTGGADLELDQKEKCAGKADSKCEEDAEYATIDEFTSNGGAGNVYSTHLSPNHHHQNGASGRTNSQRRPAPPLPRTSALAEPAVKQSSSWSAAPPARPMLLTTEMEASV